jgi:hypothetical protein
MVSIIVEAIRSLAGLSVAVKETIESSLTAEYVPQSVRSTSYGLLASINGVGDLISSAVVGLIWTTVSPVAGFSAAAIAMTVGTISLARLGD